MKPLSSALQLFFETEKRTYVQDLYTFTLTSGEVIRWTNGDRDVTWAENTFGGTFVVGPGIKREQSTLSMGLETDSIRIYLYDHPGVMVSGMPLSAALSGGLFDQAQVLIDRAYSETPADEIIDSLRRHVGTVSDVLVNGFRDEITLRSPMHKLAAPWPRNVYQPRCSNMLFDTRCGKTKSTYRWAAVVADPIQARGVAFGHNVPHDPGYYTYGTVVFTSGANEGVMRSIMSHDQIGHFRFSDPWPSTPLVGDTFDCYPGCDKRMTTCTGKFNNLPRFRGQPFIPAPETVR